MLDNASRRSFKIWNPSHLVNGCPKKSKGRAQFEIRDDVILYFDNSTSRLQGNGIQSRNSPRAS
jgi:hypothetical protein